MGTVKHVYDNLGNLYEHGHGVKKNLLKSAMWYRMSAEGNFPVGSYKLAEFLNRGMGIERNILTATKWYFTASNLNYVDAEHSITRLYPEIMSQYSEDTIKEVLGELGYERLKHFKPKDGRRIYLDTSGNKKKVEIWDDGKIVKSNNENAQNSP